MQVLYCRDKLGIPTDRLNVNGGAIAVGHPYGVQRPAPDRPCADRRQAPRREVRGGHDVHRRRHGRGRPVRGALSAAGAARRMSYRARSTSCSTTGSRSSRCCNAAALRRALARDLRRGARHLRAASRARSSRPYNRLADTEEPRFDGEKVHLPRATHAAARALRRVGHARRRAGLRARRHAAAVRRRDGGEQLLLARPASASAAAAC